MFWNRKKTSSGFFVNDGGRFAETPLPATGSVNDCTESLGFTTAQIHVAFLFDDGPRGFQNLGMLPFTRDVAGVRYVLTDKTVTTVNDAELRRAVAAVDWDFEYRPDDVNGILDAGIADGSFSSAFLNRLGIADGVIEPEGVFTADAIGRYLFMAGDRLVGHDSSSGLNPAAERLRRTTPSGFRAFFRAALRYNPHDRSLALAEVNTQASAHDGIPGGVGNEHVPAYTLDDGTVDFVGIMIDYYGKAIAEHEFRALYRGRYEELGNHTYELHGRLYQVTDGMIYRRSS